MSSIKCSDRQLRASLVAYLNIVQYNLIIMKMCARPEKDLRNAKLLNLCFHSDSSWVLTLS